MGEGGGSRASGKPPPLENDEGKMKGHVRSTKEVPGRNETTMVDGVLCFLLDTITQRYIILFFLLNFVDTQIFLVFLLGRVFL